MKSSFDFMNDVLLSNEKLDALRSAPKTVRGPNERWTEKPGRHMQCNFMAESNDGTLYRVYLRQNLDDKRDFSCGLALVQEGGKSTTIFRYNGSSHRHGDIRYRCHIHRATAEAYAAGKKIDRHAEETDRYDSLKGALECLTRDCCVLGLTVGHEQVSVFNGS